MDIKLGEFIRLKKAHPCGSYEWQVVRLGADIGLRCRKCGRFVMIERGLLERRIKGRSASNNSIERAIDR